MKKIEPYIWVGVLLTVLILIGAYHLGQRQVKEALETYVYNGKPFPLTLNIHNENS